MLQKSIIDDYRSLQLAVLTCIKVISMQLD